MEICTLSSCTGCGMCSNLCPVKAITMANGTNDFVFPKVNENICIKCNQCIKKCPANQPIERKENVIRSYAAWNKDKAVRKKSSSGGVFSVIAKSVLNNGGLVVGVAIKNLEARHVIINNTTELAAIYGSKYVQSNTGDIYKQVKESLADGTKVLFSGTPCQIHALKQYLGKEYDNLLLVDIICHGVPNLTMLHKHFKEVSGERKVKDIKFRYKDPYWDYSFVRIDYEDKGQSYQQLTVDDDYFHLFNIGFSIRYSCHDCHYTSTHRQGDITLADYWGFVPHNFKMNNYFGGISCILVNSEKGNKVINALKDELIIETASLESIKRGNMCLDKPFTIPDEKLNAFWNDYNNNMSLSELAKKHCPQKYKRPNFLKLRHIKAKYFWIIKKFRGKNNG